VPYDNEEDDDVQNSPLTKLWAFAFVLAIPCVLNSTFGWFDTPLPNLSLPNFSSGDTQVAGDEGELRTALIERYEEEFDRSHQYVETSNNRSVAIDELTDGNYLGDAWCATFVTSITGQVYKDLGLDPPIYGGEGYDGDLADYILPRVMDSNPNDVLSLVEWAKEEDRYYKRSDVRNGSHDLQPGDLVIFDQSDGRGSNHTGAVIEIDGDTIITAEGNASNQLQRNSYSNYLDISDINGFVDVGFQ